MTDINVDLLLRVVALLAILAAGVKLIETSRRGVEPTGIPYVIREQDADRARDSAAEFRSRTFWAGASLIAIAVLAIFILPWTRATSSPMAGGDTRRAGTTIDGTPTGTDKDAAAATGSGNGDNRCLGKAAGNDSDSSPESAATSGTVDDGPAGPTDVSDGADRGGGVKPRGNDTLPSAVTRRPGKVVTATPAPAPTSTPRAAPSPEPTSCAPRRTSRV